MRRWASSRLAAGILVLCGLQACAINPLVQWDPPPRAIDEPRVLDSAFNYSESARKAYLAKMYEQVGTNAYLSSGLITLGALVTALAVYGAHRDTIVGGALLGATGLTLGVWNLDKRRITIHQAAIAALNCADRAIAPLNMTVADVQALDAELKTLRMAIASTNMQIGNAERALNAWIATTRGAADLAGDYQAVISAARRAVEAAAQTHLAGNSLKTQIDQADNDLRITVREIHVQALGALANTQGDLNKLPSVIATLAATAGSFVPGSGVAQTIGDAQKAIGRSGATAQSGTAMVARPSELLKNLADMNDAVRQLTEADAAVHARVDGVLKSVQPKALEQCGVTGVSVAIATNPAHIIATAGTPVTTSVAIRGGKPPYGVRPTDIAGVTVIGPDRLANSFDVKIAADVKAPQTITFLISDSSDPNQTTALSVEINAPASQKPTLTGTSDRPKQTITPAARAKTPPEPKAPPPASKKPSLAEKVPAAPTATTAGVAETIKTLSAVDAFDLSGTSVSFPSPPRVDLNDGAFLVTVACKPTPKQCLTQEQLRQAFANKLPSTHASVIEKLKFTGFASTTCICEQR